MKTDETRLAEQLDTAFAGPDADLPAGLREHFVARLREVAGRPDRVPIRIDGERVEARRGTTVLGAALRGGFRVMHACGARGLCTTCRVRVDAGEENLSPLTGRERLALRTRLSFGPRTRLGCQARIEGPVEIHPVFPLCGNLPGE